MSVMDEKIVEAMARAIYKKKADRADLCPFPLWDEIVETSIAPSIRDNCREEARAAWDAAKAALPEAGMVIVLQKPIREECWYCKKQCDSLAGNPGLWPLHLPLDSARPGQCVAVHNRCVLDRLRDAPAASDQR